MKRAKLFALIAGAAATFAFTTACESPDSQKRFDEYSEIVGDAPPQSELCTAEVRDISGKYFLRLQHSIGPAAHILMEVDITKKGENYDLLFQPLKTDLNRQKEPRPDARTPVGEPISLTNVPMSPSGELEVNLVRIVVDGEANSVTWGEIEADIDLTVAACTSNVLCGKGKIQTYRPLTIKGTANFGALEVESVDAESTAPIDCTGEPI